nr:MAG TPA: hypothetical protein [Microviridae sp.]
MKIARAHVRASAHAHTRVIAHAKVLTCCRSSSRSC